ncbi:hypothetical protein HMPREF1549_01160 [Actinomyces johnsonii F0510]|uniref:Uncharacterized protein n=1 Tax=Actinomyces johnsonii F0510 TaxID=1227262 RepID=U1PXI8_9ACTO|nr:hypothetical protein HMPREF1549_01160 [Actinomyces johnsonii F0510]
MSALWTLGRLRDRLCGDTVAGLGSLIQGPASLFPSWPWLLLKCPKVVVQRRLRPESCPESV